jgi:hypothetical protein
MQTDFVKRRDREFEAQVAQFLANLGPVKTALGLPANWEAQLIARKNAFTNALNNTYRRTKVYKKQQLTTPSLRFPLHAGGTDGLGSPREAGGT